ncbi:tyrosine-type recombinase/integrase [Mycobacterium sp. SMC-4]|uniref:tyrosine-type recombinase/integrase n=1 Tax=Mycobacterium sp. SMC-4 TaxID=2857059 RepID=UPI0021B16280|nr:tyrosine-type recombinase/integrase [Mycobacterium sp. SMC-4]UXA16979.1 tyrosine-type recombinase/integrase [Mycobacterium sp. SMC-4]
MAESQEKLAGLVPSWVLALRAAGKSPATVDQYEISVRVFLRWCADSGVPAVLDRRTVTAFLASLPSPGTTYVRQVALKQFSRWLAAEGEIDADLLTGLTLPKVPAKAANPLTDDELAALFKACRGNTFRDRRDEAMARILAETGLRASELLGLSVDDVDLSRGLAQVRRGKGGRGRVVPFGQKTAHSIDRYMRARRELKASQLWLSESGKPLAYAGVNRALGKRAADAGIQRFHLHLLRHTMATRWLAAEGTEGGLMAVAGWRRREMLDRYVAATASDRAAAEAKRLALGEL